MRNPVVAADVIIRLPAGRLVFVRRRNPPPGWAIPGGFIESGESAERAAIREAREETGLTVELESLFHVYSDPGRDPRHHTITVVFLGRAEGSPVGGDDAAEARGFTLEEIPGNLAFDHHRILDDYLSYLETGHLPTPKTAGARSLSLHDRAILLKAARDEIGARLSVCDPPREEVGEHLDRIGAAFVSLYHHGELRGCIGHLAFDRTLLEATRDMACAAAFDDPRFPPISKDEYDELEIEISVLSRPEVSRPDRIVSGWHGVNLSARGKKAVFLPQVARGEGWSRLTLLEQLCQKGGLPPDAWTDTTAEIETFTAELVRRTP